MGEKTDPGVDNRLNNLPSTVSGIVVCDQKLQFNAALLQYAGDGFLDVTRMVEGRHYHADQGAAHNPSPRRMILRNIFLITGGISASKTMSTTGGMNCSMLA